MKIQYLFRNDEGTTIVCKNKKEILEQVPKTVINDLCMRNLSTYEGRKVATKHLYNIKILVPIYVDEDNLLFPTVSTANYDCVWINYHEILKTALNKIYMNNGDIVICGENVVTKQLKRCYEIAFS